MKIEPGWRLLTQNEVLIANDGFTVGGTGLLHVPEALYQNWVGKKPLIIRLDYPLVEINFFRAKYKCKSKELPLP